MQQSANFYFYHTLNDFLSHSQRNTCIAYNFNGTPAIKDAIEAIGIPHPEVAVILINGSPVPFSHLLQNGDQVEVYPVMENNFFPETYLLHSKESYPDKFILDVHLGGLAKLLRLLGFDTFYQNNYSDKIIADTGSKEQRIVLTRDIGLLKHRAVERGYWLRSQQVNEQVIEVIQRFQLATRFKPFTRCLACNGEIHIVGKERIMDKLPENTIHYFNEFYQCFYCRRVYWKGSHYERMQATIEQIYKDLKKASTL